MNPRRKVVRGERRANSAALHNATVEALAQAQREKNIGQMTARKGSSMTGLVLVRNESPTTVPRFGVLGIAGVAIEPEAGEASFYSEPCFVGVTPSAATPNWVVAQEPISPGAIGRSVVSGLTPLRIVVAPGDEEKRYAEPLIGSTAAAQLVESGQSEVLYRETGTGAKRALVRMSNTPSTGAGQVFLGIVKSPSVDGSIEPVYTVDVYGTTIESLSEDPTAEDVAALQSPISRPYWRAEVVAVVRDGEAWRINKLLTVPAAYEAVAGQLMLRLRTWHVDAGETSDLDYKSPSNYLLDLADVLSWFDGGNQTGKAYVVFQWGASWGGVAALNIETAVPVRFVSGNAATLVSIEDTFIEAADAMGCGAASNIAVGSTSQDTWSTWSNSPTLPSTGVSSAGRAGASNSYSLGAYVYFDDGVFQSPLSVSLLVSIVYTLLEHNADTSILFASAPAVPSIPGAIDSSLLLLWYSHARTVDPGGSSVAGPANKLHPQMNSYKALAPGSSLLGTYPILSSEALSGSVVLS